MDFAKAPITVAERGGVRSGQDADVFSDEAPRLPLFLSAPSQPRCCGYEPP